MQTMSLPGYRYAALPLQSGFLSLNFRDFRIHFHGFNFASERPPDQKPELKTCPDQASWLSQLHCFTAGTCPHELSVV